MVAELSGRVTGGRGIDTTLRHMISVGSNFTKEFGDWLSKMQGITSETFRNRGKRTGSTGREWQALAINTVSEKRKMALRGRIPGGNVLRPLMRTGKLFRSIGVRNAPDSVFEIRKLQATYGTDHPHARVLDRGIRRGSRAGQARGGHLPARRIFKILKSDQLDLLNAMALKMAKGPDGTFVLQRGRKSAIEQVQDRD